MNASHVRTLAATAAATLLSGCALTTPGWDAHFGEATRIALAQQVVNPQAAQNSAPAAGMDGRAARSAYERYQKSFSEPAAQAPLSIGSGGVR